jgi:heptosyltransferase-1
MTEPSDSQVIARYHRRYRLARAGIKLFNAALRPLFPARHSAPVPPPRRILLANYGHLGDVVISTACITILKNVWPDVEIGFLIGSWSRPVLEGHPDIRHLHVADHWFMDRGPQSRVIKAPRYWRSSRRVAREIESVGYDVAVDLRAYMPNAVPILWLANIPVRIAYTSVGFGPLLTHPKEFVFQRKHESEIQTDLLRALPIPEESFVLPAFRPAPATPQSIKEVFELLATAVWKDGAFRVLHVGASVPVRDWPTAHWRSLAERLTAHGCRLVFTGRGTRDRPLIDPVIAGLPNCLNACDKLSFPGLVELIRRAELVYSVETMAGHIAVAVGTPCVGIYGGMSDPRHWSPRPGPKNICVTHVVPCWPCFQYNGCKQMSCLRGLEVESVYSGGELTIGN